MMLAFFVVTALLFSKAKHNYNLEWMEHRRQYSIQALGIFTAIASNLVIGTLVWFKAKSTQNHIVEQTQFIYWDILWRNAAEFVFILAKEPKDCFLCFSKLKNISYSIFQIVKFTYTEQYLLIRKNAWLLQALMKLQNEDDAPVVLDDDDYLNPALALDSHAKGIDMDFMVKYVGGSQFDSDSMSDEDDMYEEVEQNELLKSRSSGKIFQPEAGNTANFGPRVGGESLESLNSSARDDSAVLSKADSSNKTNKALKR